jgi:hypothetical protein
LGNFGQLRANCPAGELPGGLGQFWAILDNLGRIAQRRKRKSRSKRKHKWSYFIVKTADARARASARYQKFSFFLAFALAFALGCASVCAFACAYSRLVLTMK